MTDLMEMETVSAQLEAADDEKGQEEKGQTEVLVESEADASPAPFQLDDQELDIDLLVATSPGKVVKVTHRFRVPTREVIHERDQKIHHETEDLNNGEISNEYFDEEANLHFWKRLVSHIDGYGPAGEGMISLSERPEVARRVGIDHRIAAVTKYLFQATRTVVESAGDESAPFALMDAPFINVIQDIGPHRVVHVVRHPTEGEWVKHDRRLNWQVQVKGTERPRARTYYNQLAGVDLYDAIIQRIEGVAIGSVGYEEEKRDLFVQFINPWHKRLVVLALAGLFEVQVRD